MLKFILIAIISIFAGAFVSSAQAVMVQSISHRSAMQNECLKENPEDHKAYLTCIKNKKEEQKNSSSYLKNEPSNTPAKSQADDRAYPAGRNQ